MPRARVIGGGVAGLVAARELAERGWQVTLHEASDRLGGTIHAIAVPDGLGGEVLLDVGAESFATRQGTVAALLDELGLASRIVAPSPRSAWLSGPAGDLPLPATGVLGIPQSVLSRDVRRVIGLRGVLRALGDAVVPLGEVSGDETVDSLVRRRVGARVADRLVAPIAEGVYSRSPDQLRVREVLPELLTQGCTRSLRAAVRRIRENRPAGAAVAGLDGGIIVLVQSLEARLRELGVQIRLEDAREAGEPGEPGDDLVVDARPGPAASRTTVVTLVLDAPELDAAPRGTGVLVTRSGGDVPRALTHSSAKWPWLAARLAPHRHAGRVSYDGHRADDAALRGRALADASRLLGIDLASREPVASHVAHWSQSERVTPPDSDAVLRLGAAVAGSGLARVIAHARTAVASRAG